MKIWVQSPATLGRDPLWEPLERCEKKHIQEVIRPSTTADLYGVEIMAPQGSSNHYFEYLHTSQIIKNAIRAESEGYDAFVLLCMLDQGFYEIREVVDIPVVFIGETCFHIASLLAPKFALLADNESMLLRITERVKRYGLGQRLVPSGYFVSTLSDLQRGISDAEPILEKARQVARAAREQGANMLICTCSVLSMILVVNGIYELEGVPVIDEVGTAVKVGELLVDLKAISVERSRLGLFAPVDKSQLSDVQRLYKV